MVSRTLSTVAALGMVAMPAFATGPHTFDFNDLKHTNAISLAIDSPLEPVFGYADDITGSATFDPDHPEKTTGTISVAVASVRFSNDGYSNSVRNYGLGQEKHPKITCVLKKIISGKVVKPGVYEGQVQVDFTIKGVTKPLTVPLKVTYLPGTARERGSSTDGDLLVVRSNFFIKRSDFGVAKEVPLELASDEVEIRVAVVGSTARPLAPPPDPPSPKKPLTVSVLGKDYPIEERMAFHKVPGCAVAVIENFKVESVSYLGNTGNETRMPINEKTLFPVGAMGGPVQDAVTLRLAQDGAIRLDGNINDYLKRWKLPASSYTASRPVTVGDLLTNRGGFAQRKYEGYDPDKPIPTLQQVLVGESPAITPPIVSIEEPGKRINFSMENAAVLQAVLEDSQGKPWQDIVRGIFGETQSFYQVFPPTDTYIRFAKGFDDDGKALPRGGRAYPELAATGLWANPAEYADFLADIMRSASGKDEGGLLKPEWAKRLFEPIVPDTDSKDGQAMAFGIARRGGFREYYRGGNTEGYFCHANIDLEKGNAIIVFANRNLCWKFTNEVRDSLAHQRGWRGY